MWIEWLSVFSVLCLAHAAGSSRLVDVQVLFRHGDRAPLSPLFANDPYGDEAQYWPTGLDQLTPLGRMRMFKLGQWIRNRYDQYLGDRYSPREVSARSSAIDRCLESAQLVLAGSYPPNSNVSEWNVTKQSVPLAHLWQPIPITTFIPADDDSLLRVKKNCPRAERQRNELMNSANNLRLLEENRQLLQEVSNVSGFEIDSIRVAARFRENLQIEHDNGYYWFEKLPDSGWDKQREMEISRQMLVFDVARWDSEYNSTLLKRVRAGEFLQTIAGNFLAKKSVHEFQTEQTRIAFFSSHDSKLAAVLRALDVWQSGHLVPYSSALLFEMHQSVTSPGQFFTQVWYLNDTHSLIDGHPSPHLLRLPACKHTRVDSHWMCPLEQFLKVVNNLASPIDWNEECDIETTNINSVILVNILLLFLNLTVMFVLLVILLFYCNKLYTRPGYQPLQ